MIGTRSSPGARRRLVARLDNVGDVLLSGPAVRAVAGADDVTYLTSSVGAAAAWLLPGVGEVITFDAPWVPFDAAPVDRAALDALRAELEGRDIDEAVVLTSHHQSPLPLALLLRESGVGRIAATSTDYPGALLDVRGARDPRLHEVEQSLQLCAEAGFGLAPGDRGALSVLLGRCRVVLPEGPYLVVHPGASVSCRGLPLDATAGSLALLADAGVDVVLTGTAGEAALVEQLLDRSGLDRSRRDLMTRYLGALDLEQLGHLVARATAVVCGNSGPAHLAAAVGTPVVEAFAPVVPAHRWHPWMVPHVLLGRLDDPCPSSCSRGCTVPAQPCLEPFTAAAVIDALVELAPTLLRPSGGTAATAPTPEEVHA